LSVDQEPATGDRQRDCPARTVEELHAEFILKSFDLHAQGRLRDMKDLGSPAEVQFASNCSEIAKMA
jgi:hypothetical protein